MTEDRKPKLFGRRKGRPLRTRRAALMETLLPRVGIAVPAQGPLDVWGLFDDSRSPPPCGEGLGEGGVPRSRISGSGQVDGPPTQPSPARGEGLAAPPSSVWLEIGFGGGEHLAAQAAANPHVGFIGCEPFVNGVASLLGHIDDQKLENVRVYPDDARVLLDALPDACLDRCFVLFADPWPKKRHHERRFIGPANLPRLARVLKPGAQLRLATDVMPLAEWMREHCTVHPAFVCAYDSVTPPPDWVETRYEQKGKAAGREPVYMIFRRQG